MFDDPSDFRRDPPEMSLQLTITCQCKGNFPRFATKLPCPANFQNQQLSGSKKMKSFLRIRIGECNSPPCGEQLRPVTLCLFHLYDVSRIPSQSLHHASDGQHVFIVTFLICVNHHGKILQDTCRGLRPCAAEETPRALHISHSVRGIKPMELWNSCKRSRKIDAILANRFQLAQGRGRFERNTPIYRTHRN
jgi:hypothetical protein